MFSVVISAILLSWAFPGTTIENPLSSVSPAGVSFNDSSPLDVPMAKELLNLLNMGKAAMGLKTENPTEFMSMVEHQSNITTADKLGQDGNSNGVMQQFSAEKIIEHSSNLKSEPDEEKFIQMSGSRDDFHVDRNENVRIDPAGLGGSSVNDTEVQDVFEMMVEKRIPIPGSTGGILERIEIIEKEDWKPVNDNVVSMMTTAQSIFIQPPVPVVRAARRVRRSSPMDNDIDHHNDENNSLGPFKALSTTNIVLYVSAVTMVILVLLVGLYAIHLAYKPPHQRCLQKNRRNVKVKPVAVIPQSIPEMVDNQCDDFVEVNLDWQHETGDWEE